ncbi:TPA: LamG domain-containing protein [Candidatus Poribacteria bacterium]|nr:LamG domain-containing protein [Candidatus Poribacteria bacterium]
MKTTVSRLSLVFTGIIVISLMLAGISYAEIDLETAVGIWLFDEGKGDVAKDLSAQGNDGTIKNAKWVKGKFGSALEFNGKDACVQTDEQLLESVEEFSIVLWANPGKLTANRIGLVGQNDAPEFGFINPTTVQLWTPTAGGLNVTYNHSFNEWHHIAGTASKEFTRVYIDGEMTEKKGAYANHGSSSFKVNIGGCGVYDPTGNFFTGILDEVAIFHVALEDDDIKTIMDDGFTKMLAVSAAGKLATSWGQIKSY